MPKLPSLHLYPGDWLRDDVAGCSLAAQGLWIRMMFVMHDAERYGYLAKNGVAFSPEFIAARCGCTPEQYTALLAELDSVGIPRRSITGIIYSKRMVEDEKARAADRERQRKHRKGKEKEGNRVTPDFTRLSEDEVEDVVRPKNQRIEQQQQALELYAQYPRKVGKSAALKAIGKALAEKPFAELRDSVCAYACVVSAWPEHARQYVWHPATFFNAGHYDDDRTTWQRDDGKKPALTVEERKRIALEREVRSWPTGEIPT